MCDDIRGHKRPPFQDISSLPRLRCVVLDVTNGKRGLASNLSLPVGLQAGVAESAGEKFPSSSMIVGVLHSEDTRVAGRCESGVEV